MRTKPTTFLSILLVISLLGACAPSPLATPTVCYADFEYDLGAGVAPGDAYDAYIECLIEQAERSWTWELSDLRFGTSPRSSWW